MDQDRFLKNIADLQKLMHRGSKILPAPIIINLPKDKGRRDSIVNHLAQFGLELYILNAVQGVNLPVAGMTEPEIGCALSHAACLKHFNYDVDPKQESAAWLILEDDARFLVNPALVACWAVLTLRDDWSVIVLGSHNGARTPLEGDFYRMETKLDWVPWGSYAYLVNPRHGRRLCLEFSECMYPADHILIREIKEGRGYLLRPSVAYHETFSSNIREGAPSSRGKRDADLLPDDHQYLMTPDSTGNLLW